MVADVRMAAYSQNISIRIDTTKEHSQVGTKGRPVSEYSRGSYVPDLEVSPLHHIPGLNPLKFADGPTNQLSLDKKSEANLEFAATAS
jgi:hypothetical protein